MSLADPRLAPALKGRRSRFWTPQTAWLFVFLLVLTAAMFLPLLFVVATALKSDSNVLEIPPSFWPREFRFGNFVDAVTKLNFGRLLLNSLILTVVPTFGSVFSSLLIAYGIARIRMPGRAVWFYLFVGSMMLPGLVTLIPMFKVYLAIGWYGTWWPLLIPPFFGNPFFIFLLRQYYLSIPRSLDEAAKIDGASHWQIFTRIMVPITAPAWIACAVFAFQGGWNDWMGPLIYVPLRSDLQPLALGLMNLAAGGIGGVTTTPWNIFMAANLLYMIPSVIIFFLAQNYFMQGVGSLSGRVQK